MADRNIGKIRKQLDEIDKRIVESLADRLNIVNSISSTKIEQNKHIRDLGREEVVLSRIRKLAGDAGLDHYFVEQLFRDIIGHAVRYQAHSLVDHQNKRKGRVTLNVAYQGTDGAYSHEAAAHHFSGRYTDLVCTGYRSFQEAAEAVENKQVDYAILPIENTTAGSINDTYDLLGEKNLFITGEEVLRIEHCLMALEPVDIGNIRRIISHPQALAQCGKFLSSLPRCHVESYIDTAMAARKVRDDADLSQAAIAGTYAAERYGLHIVTRQIANQKENFTRFVIVSREPVECDPQIISKTSLVLAATHEKGALIGCLNILDSHGINMTKLESRPRPDKPWQYMFYIDIEANVNDPAVKLALKELEEKAVFMKVFGSYPAQQPA
ncbi:MAG: prephenate dehydratase [Balneolales bacterium]